MVRKSWKKRLLGGSGSKSKSVCTEEQVDDISKKETKSASQEMQGQGGESVVNFGQSEDTSTTDETAELKVRIELADQCFLRNDFDKAIELYTVVIQNLELLEKKSHKLSSQVPGDIHVKISTILQGQAKLPDAFDHLVKAKEIYKQCIADLEGNEISDKEVLALKLVEVVTGIANICVDQGNIDNAAETYESAIQMSRDLFENEEKVADALMNYGNFLSICKEDHIGAIDTLKEVLKIQLKSSNGSMSSSSATTLNCMGKVYMRRSRKCNSKEGIKDAQRAEACFIRALQLFRFSMVKSGDEKAIDTLYNLNEARDRQTKKKGILRNVRFDSPIQPKSPDASLLKKGHSESFDSELSSCYESDDETETSFNEFTEEKKSWYTSMGLSHIFNCGTIPVNDEIKAEVEDGRDDNEVKAEVQEEEAEVEPSKVSF